MKLAKPVCCRILLALTLYGLVMGLLPGRRAGAEVGSTATVTNSPSSSSGILPELRSPDAMAKAEAANPAPPSGLIPFRPTLSVPDYLAVKAAAEFPGMLKPVVPRAPALLAPPTLKNVNFAGLSQGSSGGFFPPDSHGAVGHTQYVQIVNSRLRVYGKTPQSGTTRLPIQKDISLAAFFGYFLQPIFDPRVEYDSIWKRWIVTAEAFPESVTSQKHFIAISQGQFATGAFFIYQINVTPFIGGNFWDFPQLGMDQDAIIVTANTFDSLGAFAGSAVLTVAKARAYNGLSLLGTIFTGLPVSLAPPVVLDQNKETFLIGGPTSGSDLHLYTLLNSSRNGPSLTGPVLVPVAAFSVPPQAPQPGTGEALDTLDSRFANRSTQVGDALWQVHTIDVAGFATPRWYQIDTAGADPACAGLPCVIASGSFFASGTSHDFNAAIAANANGDVYVTWSSTDTAIQPQVRFSGKQAGDPSIPPGVAVFTSPSALTGNFDPGLGVQRWGDYPSITIDPADQSQAWGVNESVNVGGASWATRIFKIGIP